jgi:hypothetical protein
MPKQAMSLARNNMTELLRICSSGKIRFPLALLRRLAWLKVSGRLAPQD